MATTDHALHPHGLSSRSSPLITLHAEASADLYSLTKEHGMSFADRACLALGIHRKLYRAHGRDARWVSKVYPSQ